MSDLFISYSRDDSGFVQNLHEAIEASNRDAWLDCFDIPKGEKFWDEITKGIDMVDAFVFIMSPSSIEKASIERDNAYCRLEIEYAAQQNKRIIPIVYREGFNLKWGILSHKILGERNWIFFTRSNNFESQFQELIRTLETDLTYVKKHTELIVAADDWDKRGRKDKSTLLRGMRLVEAEKWLQNGEVKAAMQANQHCSDPTPTDLQRAYISESRKSAKLMQVMTVTWLLVPLTLFIPGEYFWREAVVSQSYKATEDSNDKLAQREAVITLAKGCFAQRKYHWMPSYFRERVFGNCRSLQKVYLQKANLRDAKLSSADFTGANLSGADLTNADLSNALLGPVGGKELFSSGLIPTGAPLNVVVNLSGANLTNANLSGADLTNANLSGANLLIINLSSADLTNANLSNTALNGADLGSASLSSANLSNANLYGANLYGAHLGCILGISCTNFKNIKWNDATKWPNIGKWNGVQNIPPMLQQQLGSN